MPKKSTPLDKVELLPMSEFEDAVKAALNVTKHEVDEGMTLLKASNKAEREHRRQIKKKT